MAPRSIMPATDQTIEVSSSSCGVRGGSRPGRRWASMDLPDPGGPTNSRLWPPAAAISSARLAPSCPFTSRRSRTASPAFSGPGSGCDRRCVPLKWLIRPISERGARTRASPAHAASGPLASGQIRPMPMADAATAAGRVPPTGAIWPDRPSSPTAHQPSSASSGITPMAARRARATGRSKWLPSLGRSAGARLAMMRLGGRARPMPAKAPRTLSRLSATALSGRPTMLNTSGPSEPTSWTSTSTRRASTPSNATVTARATMSASAHPAEQNMN